MKLTAQDELQFFKAPHPHSFAKKQKLGKKIGTEKVLKKLHPLCASSCHANAEHFHIRILIIMSFQPQTFTNSKTHSLPVF